MLFFSSVFSLPVGLTNAEETVSVKEFFLAKIKGLQLAENIRFENWTSVQSSQ